MNKITTKLVKDGNSIAVRLPKPLLELSGLHDTVGISAKKGQIIVSQIKQPRSSWAAKINEVKSSGVSLLDKELEAWDETLLDGIDD